MRDENRDRASSALGADVIHGSDGRIDDLSSIGATKESLEGNSEARKATITDFTLRSRCPSSDAHAKANRVQDAALELALHFALELVY